MIDPIEVDDRDLSDLIKRMAVRTNPTSSLVNQITLSYCNQGFKLEVRVVSGRRAAVLPPDHLLPNNPRAFRWYMKLQV